MIVRCGKCGVELELAGAGEFLCPSCGTRNVVRGDPQASLGGFPDLAQTTGPGAPPPADADADPDPAVRWAQCPFCSYRFALGEVDEVVCPNCSKKLVAAGNELKPAE